MCRRQRLLFSEEIFEIFEQVIRVITKLPNSEQSYKGKVKTHNYINRQNQSTTGKRYNLVLGSLRLANREVVYEKRKWFQTRLFT